MGRRCTHPARLGLAAALVGLAVSVSAIDRLPTLAGDGVTDDAAALQSAIDAVAAVKGVVAVPPGTYRFSTTLLVPDGVHVVGSGVKATNLHYSGNGTAVAPRHAGTRSYAIGLRDLSLSTDTGAIGVDLDSVSTSEFQNVSVVGFRDKGFWLHSVVKGGAVYNRFENVGVQGARVGYRLDGPSSNANTWVACRCNLCSGRGWDINDSNDNTVAYSQAEAGGVGFRLDAAVAGTAAQNRFIGVRAEANRTGIEIASDRVTDAVILAPWFGGNGEDIQDRGRRTLRYGTQGLQVVAAQNIGQPFLLERTAGGGAEIPALILRDAVSSAGTPVTLQIETERGGGHFLRGTRGGSTYFDVDASGTVVASGAVSASGFIHRQVTPAPGPTVRIDASSGAEQTIVATSSAPFRIESPIGARAPGQQLTIRVRNAGPSGIERVEWGSDYKLAPWESPRGGFSRAVTFGFDGRSWVEVNRTSGDVPN